MRVLQIWSSFFWLDFESFESFNRNIRDLCFYYFRNNQTATWNILVLVKIYRSYKVLLLGIENINIEKDVISKLNRFYLMVSYDWFIFQDSSRVDWKIFRCLSYKSAVVIDSWLLGWTQVVFLWWKRWDYGWWVFAFGLEQLELQVLYLLIWFLGWSKWRNNDIFWKRLFLDYCLFYVNKHWHKQITSLIRIACIN